MLKCQPVDTCPPLGLNCVMKYCEYKARTNADLNGLALWHDSYEIVFIVNFEDLTPQLSQRYFRTQSRTSSTLIRFKQS